MRRYLAALFVLTGTMAITASQSGLAQSPPSAGQDVPIWSDRDLSLHASGFTSDPEAPHIDLPSGFFEGRPGQVLVCEPGPFAFVETAPAAYAQAGKRHIPQAR